MLQSWSQYGSMQVIMRRELGPMEYVDGLWVIGDPDGGHMKLTPRGLAHWVNGSETVELKWSRFIEFGLQTQPSKRGDSKRLVRMAKILADLSGTSYMGSKGSRVAALLRQPLEEWAAEFDHHARKYESREIALADELLRRVTADGNGARLGNVEWFSAVVQKIHQLPSSMRVKAVIKSVLSQD